VKLSVLCRNDEPAYETFLLGMDDSLLYYSLSYKSFLQDLLECQAEYWIAWDGDRVTGVLPLMWREGPFGRVLNSLPYYGSNGGVVATTIEAGHALTEKYNQLASAPEVLASAWICHPLRQSELRPKHTFVDERIGQFTSLEWSSSDVELAMRAAIDGSARRNIQKAQSSGVSVRMANEEFEFIHRIHFDNMKEIQGKAKSKEFFAKIPHHFKADSDYRIYVAERSGRMISGLLLFYFNRTVEYFTPVTVSTERESQPMALILSKAMVEAAQAGYIRWNWGGTWLSQDGVWRFKRKWGATEYRYNYFVQLNAPKILEHAKSELLEAYPDFFVVPFTQLRSI
jgi:hypothetical protein